MSLLSILNRYKKEDAVLMQKEQLNTGLSTEEKRMLDLIKDNPKPFDSALNDPNDTSSLGKTIKV